MKINKKGFTLIELLVVVLIIGILAAIALPQYMKAVDRARATEAVLLSKAISEAMNRYYMQNRTYSGAEFWHHDDSYSENISNLDIELPFYKDHGFFFYLYEASGSKATLYGVISHSDAGEEQVMVINLERGTVKNRYCPYTSTEEEKLCKSLFGSKTCSSGKCSIE